MLKYSTVPHIRVIKSRFPVKIPLIEYNFNKRINGARNITISIQEQREDEA